MHFNIYIVDYVSKRFPGATRSEIVLQINMKCKEARVILSKRESEAPKKATVRLVTKFNYTNIKVPSFKNQSELYKKKI